LLDWPDTWPLRSSLGAPIALLVNDNVFQVSGEMLSNVVKECY
jgi:hypothetical protein